MAIGIALFVVGFLVVGVVVVVALTSWDATRPRPRPAHTRRARTPWRTSCPAGRTLPA